MTTTPLATIAEALIEFILSLLRDPQAAADFEADPDRALARAGLADICATDVRSVLPVVVDRPDVVTKPVPVQPKPTPKPVKDPEVVKHISTIANNYHIDNRSTIVDQSVNQNIWAEGDVTQIFDQEAVLAVGDNSVAAGDNALIDNSTTDISTGDVAIGNTDSTVTVNDSFNDSSTTVDAEVEDSFNDESTNTTIDADVSDSFNQSTETEVDVDVQVESGTAALAAVQVDTESYSSADADASSYAAQVESEPMLDTDYDNS